MVEDVLFHLDSNVLADFSRGRHRSVVERMKALPRERLTISVVAFGELLVGAEKTGDAKILAEVGIVLGDIRRIPADESVAREYARLRAQLERTGQKMDGNDLWIAATALVHGATLVTADEAFARVPGLNVGNWRV